MTFDPEHLTENAELLQRLARQLIPDRDEADDAAQNVALAYLGKRPDAVRDVRAWLIAALRLERLRWFKLKPRRVAHDVEPERLGDHRQGGADPASSEICELIAHACRALREPYQGVLWASLFEGRSLDDIARQLGRSHATVRSQHARGLELLRQGLDRRHGGRDAWAATLLSGLRGGSTRAQPVVRSVVLRWGWVAIPLVWIGVWYGLRGEDAPDGSVERTASAEGANENEDVPEAPIAAARDVRTAAPETRTTSEPPTPRADPAPEGLQVARVRVVDLDGIGVPGASIATTEFARTADGNPDWTVLATTDALGHAELEIPRKFFRPQPSGGDHAMLTAAGEGNSALYSYWLRRDDAQRSPATGEVTWMPVGPAPAYMEVRVLDRQGSPVPGAESVLIARVELGSVPTAEGMFRRPIDGYLIADGHGVARSQLAPVAYSVSAWAPSRGLSTHEVDIRQSGVLDLPADDCELVRGRVLDEQGRPLVDALVRTESSLLTELLPPTWNTTRTDAEGGFELLVPDERSVAVRATHPEDETRTASRVVERGSAELEELLLTIAETSRISVQVVGPDGVPLANRPVVLYVNESVRVSENVEYTDPEGRVAFDDPRAQRLALGVYEHVGAMPPASAVLNPFVPQAGDNVVVVREPTRERSEILGRIAADGWQGPQQWVLHLGEPRLPSDAQVTVEAGEDGFAIPDLPPGEVQLCITAEPSFAWDLGVARVPAGTFLDLGDIRLAPPLLVGFVLDPTLPDEEEMREFRIERNMVGQSSQKTLVLQGMPQAPVALLQGDYFAVFVDRGGNEHRSDFTVGPGEPSSVVLRR